MQFKTKDLPLTCYLTLSGYEIEGTEIINDVVYFIFNGKAENLEQHVTLFYRGRGCVPPMVFTERMKSLRNMCRDLLVRKSNPGVGIGWTGTEK